MIQTLEHNGKLYHIVSKKSPLIGSQTYLTITEDETGERLQIKGIKDSPRHVLYKVESFIKDIHKEHKDLKDELTERFHRSIQLYEAMDPQPKTKKHILWEPPTITI